MILSILIPTTPDRSNMFNVLYSELQRQHTYMKTFHPSLGEIEILVDDSKPFLEGGLSIGKKREALVRRAQGKYLCFVDSDDMISPNYMEEIVRACVKDFDLVTFYAIAKLSDFWSYIDISKDFTDEAATPYGTITRRPSLICPVRSIFAKVILFEDISYGEDSKWMDRVLTMCKTQFSLTSILYEYRHGLHSEADQIIKAGYK